MPANRVTTSATTSKAAGISTSLPTKSSSAITGERRRGDITTSPAVACVASAFAIFVSLRPAALRQFADRLLQDRPRLLAVFSLPFGIKAGGAQLVAEWRQIRLIESQTLGGEFLADGCVKLFGVGSRLQRRLVDVLFHDRAYVRRQRVQSPAVGQEPI